MSDKHVCLKCGGTGLLISGEACDCGVKPLFEVPICIDVPTQYQGVKYNKCLVPADIDSSYGRFMEELLTEVTTNMRNFSKNYIICAPPSSGKTVWAYTVYGMLFAAGAAIPEIMDLMQVRDVMLNYYNTDSRALELLSTAPLAVIKLPWDLPNRFPETVSTIIDRRVRAGCSTIFLFNGSKYDLMAKDTFGKLRQMEGDGSFTSICIKSWERKNVDAV